MSQGHRWIDEVMAPLSSIGPRGKLIDAEIYNRIYEAVGRGTPEQGRALVAAICKLIDQAQKENPKCTQSSS